MQYDYYQWQLLPHLPVSTLSMQLIMQAASSAVTTALNKAELPWLEG